MHVISATTTDRAYRERCYTCRCNIDSFKPFVLVVAAERPGRVPWEDRLCLRCAEASDEPKIRAAALLPER